MKNVFWLSALIILSAIFGSCSKDDDEQTTIPEGEKTSVSVSLNIAPVNAMGTNVNDSRTSIENFWLLEFDEQGRNVAVVKELRFNINSPEAVELVAGSNMKLVVVANVDKSIVFQLGKQTYENFKNAIYTIPVNSSNSIPLVGEQTVSITKENQTLDAITLTRIAAELKFTVANNSSDFKIISMSLKNLYKMYYISKGEISQGNIADYSETPCTIGEESYTYYIAENLMGTNSGIASDKDKVTDKLATYIEIVGERMSEGNKEVATFKMFIGENAKDFNVKRNYAYNYDIDLDLADVNDKRIITEKIPLEGLAAEANCYMLIPNSEHELLIPVKRVNTFWGSEEGGFKTDKMLNDGNNQGKVTKWIARIITKDSPKELLTFTNKQGTTANDYIGIKALGNEGNVLIGIFDATEGEPSQDAKPLWSWHIWITNYNPGGDINGTIPAISQNPGKTEVTGGYVYRFGGIDNNQTQDGSTQAMMDRNLGALSASPEDGTKTIGMYYQYGRKDPFMTEWDKISELGTSSLGGKVYSINIKTEQGPVSKENAVQNPNIYFTGDPNNFSQKDWLITGSGNTELWYKKSDEKVKTLYDPCPAGWRVPYKANTYTELNGENVGDGIYLCPSNSIKIFYPFSGHLNAINGQYPGGSLFDYKATQNGWLASYTDNPSNANSYYIFSAALVDEYDGPYFPIRTADADGKYLGYNVRCVKE